VVITIAREGEKLYSQQSGNLRPWSWPAPSDTEFYAPALNAYGRFEADAQGSHRGNFCHLSARGEFGSLHRASILPLRQRYCRTCRQGLQIKNRRRVVDVVLRRLLDSIRSGEPIFNEMRRANSPTLFVNSCNFSRPTAKYLGAVTSIEFRGVGNQGYDVYTVHCERGDTQWRNRIARQRHHRKRDDVDRRSRCP